MGGKNDVTCARARGAESGDSVSKAAKLVRAGQLKAQLESGVVDLEEYAQTCVDGLQADKTWLVEGILQSAPDWPTRLAFLKFITETVEGMPIKRQEMVHRKIPSNEDLEGLLRRSPAFAREVRRILDELEGQMAEKAAAPVSLTDAIESGNLD